MTYFCYIDESGTPEVPGTSRYFVLVGLAIPIERWRTADQQIKAILARYDLADHEIHTAWLLRPYIEEKKIRDFGTLSRADRRSAVERYRAGELLRLRKLAKPKAHRQAKKNFRHTSAYVHLTQIERRQLILEVAQCVASWDFAVLFAEAIDKLHFDEQKMGRTISDQAFEQLVSRFAHFLSPKRSGEGRYGVLVHDNNQTVARKHTELMRRFHDEGTVWAKIERIGETPLFVDSSLTRMVQIADLCSYALRRYHENAEEELLEVVLSRADRVGDTAVGIRHFSDRTCVCRICEAHYPRMVARLKSAKDSKVRVPSLSYTSTDHEL